VDEGDPPESFEQQRLANVHPAGWVNPAPADRYDLVVIGGGPAGLVACEAAGPLGVRVALIENDALGGNNLNTGSVPSKALLRTARLCAEMRAAGRYGARAGDDCGVDFAAAMARMRRVRARISRVDSARRLAQAGVDVFFGDAVFSGVDRVDVAGARLHFSRALIATGARPDTPQIPGLADAGYLTNETVFDITAVPARLLVIGGGPLGCELAQAFARFGARTTIAQAAPLFLAKEERDAAQLLSEALARDGVQVRLNTSAVSVRVARGGRARDESTEAAIGPGRRITDSAVNDHD
jgi:pyruvate/2-oxoglutarate dehydrogenase complex dihydrolipoamide dehydrogenase (E3) component